MHCQVAAKQSLRTPELTSTKTMMMTVRGLAFLSRFAMPARFTALLLDAPERSVVADSGLLLQCVALLKALIDVMQSITQQRRVAQEPHCGV
jgi:hypothetical protein